MHELDFRAAGSLLYNIWKEQHYSDFAIEQLKSTFYSHYLRDHIPVFKEFYDILKEGKYIGEDNAIMTGDMDESCWIEEGPENYKIIAVCRHCSCADDNTHIYILKELEFEGEVNFDFTKFMGVTAWPEETKNNFTFGDHRDIDHPSIQTFRDNDFNFGYGDARDDHFSFKYDAMFDKAEDAHYKEQRLLWAISSLKMSLDCVKYELEHDK